jgi:tungstate transport system substrate-binding protein
MAVEIEAEPAPSRCAGLVRTILFAALGLLLVAHPAYARPITVATPAGVTAELISALVRHFEEQSGQEVRLSPLAADELARTARDGGADALLIPSRIELGTEVKPVERATVFVSDVVLVGSRADRARVRGSRDIRTALRWIAGARALTVSSSPELGLRDLELRLWEEVGVNVRGRPTWYEQADGDDLAIAAQAAASGSYALVEQATWAGMRDRRGLEVIAAGDPVLVTQWSSVLLAIAEPKAWAWHDWLASEAGRRAIRDAEVNGVAPFRTGRERSSRRQGAAQRIRGDDKEGRGAIRMADEPR